MDTEYSKRVYQGVRVKHTVKDLLAKKRSAQTSGHIYSSPHYDVVQMIAWRIHHSSVICPNARVPHAAELLRMRRPFMSDSDSWPSSKQFSPDMYSSTLGGKSLGCDPSTMSSYSSLIDSYYPETFGDYRSAAAFSSSGGSFLPSSALSSLLPPFGGESSHLFLKDSWEQPVPEPVPQVEPLCPNGLASVIVPPSMPSPRPPGSPSQYRSPSRGSSMVSSSQPYTLHPLEDAHYQSLTSSSSLYPLPSTSYPCPPYMSSPVTDLVSKMVTEEAEDGGHASLPTSSEAHSCWPKEDGVSAWSPYEIRRAY